MIKSNLVHLKKEGLVVFISNISILLFIIHYLLLDVFSLFSKTYLNKNKKLIIYIKI